MITKEYFNLRLNLEVEGDQRFVGAILIQVAYRAIGCLLGELHATQMILAALKVTILFPP